MKTSKPNNRRDFLKQVTLGSGVLAMGLNSCAPTDKTEDKSAVETTQSGSQIFNMCGFAAPKIDKVRVGLIGLGSRGSGAVRRLLQIDNLVVNALSDQHEERVKKAQEVVKAAGLPEATEYFGNLDEWKKLCERDDIDLVYICTPWAWHTPMAVYAMEQGKHVATEVPAAKTMDECWQLVETSEKTKKHCMMLENCCYDFFELMTLNMARQDFFGEIVHVEGSYIHTLLDMLFNKNQYADMWRLEENQRDGNLYPTHGLGPVCQILNINRGDKMEYLTSMSSNDFQTAKKAAELAASDDFYKKYANVSYKGNMNTTVVKTDRGKTIMIQHDIISPRPYSRIHLVSGTKGVARKWPEPAKISTGHEWVNDEEMRQLEEQYTPEIVKHIGNIAKEIGGHGGMDFIMDWRMIDCLRNGLPLDMDVYDAASWSCITPLSEWSVANRSNSIDVPDFTRGAWKHNKPHSISLEGGATTGVRERA
jgi:predicted dehydrogenase